MSELRVCCARPSDLDEDTCAWLAQTLDAHEQARAARLRFDADRRAYVLSHALRRAMLGSELRTPPRDLRFSHDGRGCPHLVGPIDETLFFSHSRTREAVACALTRIAPVGVDVEPIDSGRADAALLERFVRSDSAHPGAQQARSFFLYWTAVEAFWKAQGTGLAEGNARIDLSPRLDAWSGVHVVSTPSQTAGYVMSLAAPEGCVLSIALTHMHEVPRLVYEPYSSGMEIKQLFKEKAAP